MKEISKDAKLSQIYTNHCIRATSVTVLSNDGHDANDIIAISGHKNTSSLIPYTRKVGDSKRRKMSSTLTGFIKGEENPKSPPCSKIKPKSPPCSTIKPKSPPCSTLSIPPQENDSMQSENRPPTEPCSSSQAITENISQSNSEIVFQSSMKSVAKLVENNVMNAQSISFNFNFK